jgi:hypothetical protein
VVSVGVLFEGETFVFLDLGIGDAEVFLFPDLA